MRRQRSLIFSFLVLLLAAGAGFVAIAPHNATLNLGFLGYQNDLKLKEGLDLRGGIQFLMKASCPTTKPNCDINGLIQPTINNIQQRINGGLGVSEAVVTSQKDATSGITYISIEIPGIKDDAQALNLIGKTGLLEIIDTGANYVPPGTKVTPGQYKTVFTGTDLDPNSISVSFNQGNQPQIDFAMQGAAKDRFADYTQKNIGQYLTITLDSEVIESATIQSQITGPGQISGSLTLAQATSISQLLRYGSLPLPLTLNGERQIDPTLGQQAINQSIQAAIIGLGLVILFMLVYYRLPGLVAALALALYAALVISILKLIGAVLTLAGIAGLILSIGMAVDANVLIFERIKEELRAGRTLSAAIEIGWKRAWPSIRDSNMSTIITCLILSYFGNNFGATIIVGFATNLLIGVVTSLFTAVVVTRTLLSDLVSFFPWVVRYPGLFGLPKGAITVPTYRRPNLAAGRRPAVALAGAGDMEFGDDETEE
ncbi:MAG: protein translocase subunit SecD [Ktedonobacterales bacterium]|nr:protein translocase subunit SecD [Ktedonobacterales bacterium]